MILIGLKKPSFMKTLNCILLLLFCSVANSQVLNSKFDSKNHPKAKGVWATVRYPSAWEVKEGERPNIVKKFSGNYNDMFVILSLQILDAGGEVEKECSDMPTSEFAEIYSDKSINQIATNVKKTKHEGKPAFLFDLRGTYERAGMSFTTIHRAMTVCHKNTMISTWCSPMKFDYTKQSIISNTQQLLAANPLCFQFFNSLVLMENY